MKFGFLSLTLVLASSSLAFAQANAVFLGASEVPAEMQPAAERGITQALARASIELQPTDHQCTTGDAACVTRTLRATSTEAAIFYAVFPPNSVRAEGLILVEFHDDTARKVTGRYNFNSPAELTPAAIEATLSAISQWPQRYGATGHLAVDGTPPGATVHLNGAPAGNLPFEDDLPAGSYTVRVFAQGRQDHEEQVEVTPDQITSLRVQLSRGDEGDQADPVITPPPPRPTERGSALPSYLVGGGLVLAGAALLVPGFYALANDGECADTPCRHEGGRPRLKVDFDGGDVALLIIGGALVVGGGALFAARPWRLSPTVSATSGGANLLYRF